MKISHNLSTVNLKRFVYVALLCTFVSTLFWSSTSTVWAASTVNQTYFTLADTHVHYYPYYLDDKQNPDWTQDGGVDDFGFMPFHKTYAKGNVRLGYEVYLENDEGERLLDGAQVTSGDVVRVVTEPLSTSRDIWWDYGMETTNWKTNYSYASIPKAPLSNGGGGPDVKNNNADRVAIVGDLSSIRRQDIDRSRFSYRGPWNGEAYYLAMFVKEPTVTHAVAGSAPVTQLSETSYRVDGPGSLTVQTTYAATEAKEYYAMSTTELNRIISIYETLGYQSEPLRALAYDRLQDLKSKARDGLAIEAVEFSSGSTLPLPATTLYNNLTVIAAESVNPPASTVNVVNSDPIYPGDTVTIEISTPGAVHPVVYKMDWDNNLTNDEIVGPPGPGTNFATGDTVLTTTRQWTIAGEKKINVRTYNIKGYLSDWTPVTVTVVPKPPVTMNFEMQVNGGLWTSDDRTINPGDSLAVRWNSQFANTCVGFNVNTNGATTTMPGGVTVTAPAAGSDSNYRVECTDGITVDSSEISVDAPVSPELYAYLQPSTYSDTYNYTTGSYDEYTVNFVLANNAPADEPTSIPYTVSLDLDANGTYELTRSGSFPSGIGPDSQLSRNVTFTDIPFGTMGIKVDIAYAGLSDLQTVVNIPPPEPATTLNVTPIIVRTGTEALIEWDVGAEYPMDCTLRGGSLLTTFDPSVDGATGSTTTPALHSAMQYELRCLETNTGTEFTEEFRVEVIGSPIEI